MLFNTLRTSLVPPLLLLPLFSLPSPLSTRSAIVHFLSFFLYSMSQQQQHRHPINDCCCCCCYQTERGVCCSSAHSLTCHLTRRHLALQTVVRVPGADCGLLRLSFANSTRLDSFHSFTFDSLIHSRRRRLLLLPFLSVCLLIPKRSSLIVFGLQQQQQQLKQQQTFFCFRTLLALALLASLNAAAAAAATDCAMTMTSITAATTLCLIRTVERYFRCSIPFFLNQSRNDVIQRYNKESTVTPFYYPKFFCLNLNYIQMIISCLPRPSAKPTDVILFSQVFNDCRFISNFELRHCTFT